MSVDQKENLRLHMVTEGKSLKLKMNGFPDMRTKINKTVFQGVSFS